MQKIKLALLAFALPLAILSCQDKNKNTIPDVEPSVAWGSTLRGDDQTLKGFPDIFAYYWEYTFDAAANPNLGLRLEGAYPDARFFNLNVYDDVSQMDVSSVEDVNVKPDGGKVNPFVTEGAPANQTYTINIVPAAATTSGMLNVCTYPALDKLNVDETTGGKRISIMLRYYLPVGDIFGGVSLPKITAFDATTGKKVELPKRERCGIYDVGDLPGGAFGATPITNWFRAPLSFLYPNRPTDYLYTRNQLLDNEVVIFNFKAPKAPTKVSEYPTADVRYWSVCVGGQDTYSYVSIYDKQITVDANGMANFVMLNKNSQNYDAITKICKEKGYNPIVWDSSVAGKGIMVLYRHMVINKAYTHSFTSMESYMPPAQIVPTKHMADIALGEYGAFGKKVSEADFLGDNYLPFRPVRGQ